MTMLLLGRFLHLLVEIMSMRYQTYEFSARMGIGVPKNAAPIRQANGDAALINMGYAVRTASRVVRRVSSATPKETVLYLSPLKLT